MLFWWYFSIFLASSTIQVFILFQWEILRSFDESHKKNCWQALKRAVWCVLCYEKPKSVLNRTGNKSPEKSSLISSLPRETKIIPKRTVDNTPENIFFMFDLKRLAFKKAVSLPLSLHKTNPAMVNAYVDNRTGSVIITSVLGE